MITIKDYAESQGITIQAVYQQINRETNRKALDGHIFRDEYGTKLLDDFAVEYLLKRSLKNTGNSHEQDSIKAAYKGLEAAFVNMLDAVNNLSQNENCDCTGCSSAAVITAMIPRNVKFYARSHTDALLAVARSNRLVMTATKLCEYHSKIYAGCFKEVEAN